MTRYSATGGARPGRKGCGYRVDEHSACKIIPALSLTQPWAWAILHAGKDLENRKWPTKYRGPLWIHAARATLGYAESADCIRTIRPTADVPSRAYVTRAALVGLTWVVGCARNRDATTNALFLEYTNPWAFAGQHGWQLDLTRTWRTTSEPPVVGALGLWRPTDDEATTWEALLPEAAREALREWRGR